MPKIKFEDKQKVSVFLPKSRAKLLKKKAITLGISLSELVSISASEYQPNKQVSTIPLDTTRYIFEVLEQQEYRFLFEGLRILDLGCNIGAFSLWIYPFAERIWAVDMDQSHIDNLNKTIKDNELKNLQTYTERVSDLYEFMSGHSIRDVDVLKIDVEGDEYEILNKDFPNIPTIIGEYHRESLKEILEPKGYRYQDLPNNHFIARR